GNFAAGTNYNVTDGVSTVIARVGTADLDMVGTPIPTGRVMLTGVVDQFDSNAANGLDDGYEIQLLSLSGIVCCCPGDMNFSGVIDLNDTSLFINALVGSSGIICADMNGDGKQNGLDVKGFTAAVIANGGAGTSCGP